MTILKAEKDNALFISNPIEQGVGEAAWTDYNPVVRLAGQRFNIYSGETTSTTLATTGFEEFIPLDNESIIIKDGTNSNIVRGIIASTGVISADLSTASYDSVSFSVNAQDTNPYGIAFNNDGSKMYMVGDANDSVYQYTVDYDFGPNFLYQIIQTGTAATFNTLESDYSIEVAT